MRPFRATLALAALFTALLTPAACNGSGDTGGSAEDTATSPPSGSDTDGSPETGTMSEDTTSPGPDTGGMPEDTGSNGGDTGRPSGGIPDRITTAGGAGFSGEIDADSRIGIELVAEKGDVITMHLRRAGRTNWKPALYLFRPASGSQDERIAWHEPEGDGPAHVPYEDRELSDGWEFYAGGSYRLEIGNLADSPGELTFELECLAGPCTSSDDDDDDDGGGSGSDQDGVPEAQDNCPATDNAGQANADHDIWGDACDSQPNTLTCPTSLSDGELERRLRAAYAQFDAMDYNQAREELFSRVANHGGTVETAYTGETIRTTGIPDPDEYNTEHTWPRSKMKDEMGRTLSDLNHLYAAADTANKERANLPFAEVTGRVEWSQGGSKRGADKNGWKVFEPRDAHKGDAARALFYYAVIHDREIDIDAEPDGWGIGTGREATLRRWHKSVDPVDGDDESRNRAIQDVQGNRNPFVDCPGLVEQISDF